MKIIIIALTILSTNFALADEQANFQKLSFLSGCWTGNIYGSVIQENWGNQTGGIMLGNSKTIKGNTIEGFEFLKIQMGNSFIVYTPYINGKEAISFPLDSVSTTKVIFKNMKNDFPQTIQYELVSGQLSIKLDGSGQEFSYSLESVDCT